MALTDHVRLTLITDATGIARLGFGIPLILSHSATWVERSRTYTSLTGVGVDFGTTSPEYRAAQGLFAQKPKPRSIMIGRAALSPTQVYVISVDSLLSSTDYKVKVKGEGITDAEVTASSDASATNDEVVDLLVTALNGVASKNYLAAATGSVGSKVCTVTATLAAWANTTAYVVGNQVTNGGNIYQCITAGTSAGSGGPTGTTADITDGTVHWKYLRAGSSANAWFSLEVSDVNKLGIKQTHADPGVATDLAAILNASPGWYALITMFNSKAYVMAAAAWIEAADVDGVGKIYLPDVNETEAIKVVVGSGTDTLAALKTGAYGRVAGLYHPNPAACFSARWLGRMLPTQPGAATWHAKTLAGIDYVDLTPTHRANLVARNANSYELVAGTNRTFRGMMGDGEFIDTVRGLDWFVDDCSKAVYETIANSEKVEMEDSGGVKIENAIRGSGMRAEKKKIFAKGSFDVVVPLVDDLSDADRGARLFTGIEFTARLSGAIHEVEISGTVTA